MLEKLTLPIFSLPLILGVAFGAPVSAQSPSPVRVISVSGGGLSGLSSAPMIIEDFEVMKEGEGAPKGVEGDGKEGETAEKEGPKIDKSVIQKYQQVPLDRRASTRLRIWSLEEPLPVDEDPELKLPEEPPKEDTLKKPKKVKELFKKGPRSMVLMPAHLVYLEYFKPVQEKAVEDYEQAKKDLKKAKKDYDKALGKVKAERLKREVEIFQRHITLGRWDQLAPIFELIKDDSKDEEKEQWAEARKVYTTMLTRLAKLPPQGKSSLKKFWEQNTFAFEDLLELMDLAPGGFEKTDYALMAPLLRYCLSQGHDLEEVLSSIRSEVAKSEEDRRMTSRQAALLMTAQGLNVEMGEFLPSLGDAVLEDDREALNLLARHFDAKSRADKDFDILEQAWEATLAALAPGEVEDDQKTEALKRAVALAPRLQSARGDDWLVETFSTRPERGMEVIATIGLDVSTGMVESNYDPDKRLKAMKLLRSSVDSLLEKAPERAEEWADSLNLLADCWLREAEHSYEFSQSSDSGPSYRRDSYGNIYWTSYDRGYRSNPVKPLAPGELLEIRPDGRWHELLHDSVRPKFDTTVAELYLKVNEEKKAFPFIQQLAQTNPKKANELAAEFLNVWIRNNDPNNSRNRVDIYSYSWGYNNRASGIPLTRSKQERNLKDLAEWVQKLRSVPGIELDSALLMRAFTGSHSYAEVYRIETMVDVFGDLDKLDPETLAKMAQTMRANLAGLWRAASVQANAKTNRKKKDIEAEVQLGYSRAQEVLALALKAHPGNWRLEVARASMMHDLNNYQNEIQKTKDFAGDRQDALDLFASAAESYVETVEDLRVEEFSNDAFSSWFYSALGATDVDAIDQDTILANSEIDRIRDVLESIPGEPGETQIGLFANGLFTRLSEVNASVKNRYLEAGFSIVGEHPQAAAARKVFDYYRDLVTEIELVSSIDGDTDVGTSPFGVKVELTYTKHMERESGGFQKYLQNQANKVNYYYNYGRPQENYRDKFEEAARTILEEQFEVMSITFNKEDASSKPVEQEGWRRMPYAYILLKAKGPEIDRIPPLKLDLDFNDVTGYVVLPIASSVVPIDASARADERPYENLQVTQILDERESDKGILSVEIKAQADGIVPELKDILDVVPADFEIDNEEDLGISVARFSDSGDTVLTERLWKLNLKAKSGVEKAAAFNFGAPRDEDTQVVYQRYDDADLISAEPMVNLLAAYGSKKTSPWVWILCTAIGSILILIIGRTFTTTPEPEETTGLAMPTSLTPFTVIGMLRQVQAVPNLPEHQVLELESTVGRIESYYFGQEQEGDKPDLPSIAREWARRA